jgi:transcriptional regulator with XRE-family HTH domain
MTGKNSLSLHLTNALLRRNMTVEELKQFFEERPALTMRGINDHAGLSDNYLNRILREDRKISQKTLDKLLPVLKIYGYGCNNSDSK